MAESRLAALTWPRRRMGEALAGLAAHSGWSQTSAPIPQLHDALPEAQVPAWLDRLAAEAGLELEPAVLDYRRARSGLEDLAPALIRPVRGEGGALCVLRVRRGRAWLMGPAQQIVAVAVRDLAAALCAAFDEEVRRETEALLGAAAIPARRLEAAREAILMEWLGPRKVAHAWLVELAPSRPFLRHLTRARAIPLLSAMALCHAAQYGIWIGAWALVGRISLQGERGPGWFAAWVLLLATMLPIQALGTWLTSLLGVAAGGLVRARLLYGALRLNPDVVRHTGASQLLGRVLEAEGIETLALGAGLSGLVATLELGLTGVVLALGAGGGLHVLLLILWLTLAVLLTRVYHGRRAAWTERRLGMTHELVERLVGYRTSLIQEQRQAWHQGEDQALGGYIAASADMDRQATWLNVGVPRGWLLIGWLGLLPSLLRPDPSIVAVAVGLGGVWLGQRAFSRLTPGLIGLAGALVSWTQAQTLFQATSSPESLGAARVAELTPSDAPSSSGPPLIVAHDLGFGYEGRPQPILAGCSLTLRRGERVLLEGPSGGGKSTLAALLAGWREPRAGSLLLRGLDRHSLGAAAWRRRVVAVPQFHHNHVFTETFAFNLLMGRAWPPDAEAWRRAEEICARLGLDELLRKMPGGMLQMVGDTGWQLSHGERSRLFIARALLQDADLVLLDESFAALDPRTLEQCLNAALELAPTLLVIAHP